jgi:hypothetical protein
VQRGGGGPDADGAGGAGLTTFGSFGHLPVSELAAASRPLLDRLTVA